MGDAEKGTALDWPAPEAGESAEVYARYAEIYDELFEDTAPDATFYLQRSRELLEPGDFVLELGSGTGRVTSRLIEAGYSVTGVDASEPMLGRAAERLAAYGARYQPVCADVRTMRLPRRYKLAIAPFGMVAHLLSDDDRRAAFGRVFEQLEPGGLFVFDDMPSWLAVARGEPISDGTALEALKTGVDPRTNERVRLMINAFDAADVPCTVRYDIIDWLDGTRVSRRKIVRVVFRNTEVQDELAFLKQAGFSETRLFGGFDGRPFDATQLSNNSRFVVTARRAP